MKTKVLGSEPNSRVEIRHGFFTDEVRAKGIQETGGDCTLFDKADGKVGKCW